jgi:uncharacterized membrane protein HdeD (DUF308 family)
MRSNELNLVANESIAPVVRIKWISFFVLGLMLALCGIWAIVLPRISTIATGLIVGAAFGFGGLFQIAQTFQIKTRMEFVWIFLIGAIELVGGVLIYFNPFAGTVAVTVLIALVLFVQGLVQIAFAVRARPYAGWRWMLSSGLVALLASAAIVLHFPFSDRAAPGLAAGVSLLFAGCCYIAIALSARQTHHGPRARP